MKKNLFGLLIVILFVITGCKKLEQEPVIIPQGKFSGKFTRLHLNKTTNKIDTANANMVINFSTTTGFEVLSDTSAVHAGSKGTYVVDPLYIQFGDNTIPAGPIPTTGKVHLAGFYEYYYKDNILKIGKSNDTLSYTYDLTLIP